MSLLTGLLLPLMYRLKMVKKVIPEKKEGGSDEKTSLNKVSKPKIGRMAWINYLYVILMICFILLCELAILCM